jgi:integrase
MAKVILHKKIKTDLSGIVGIMYFGYGKKKQRSLSFKMLQSDFDTNFIKPLNQFMPSPNYDYTVINQLINDTINIDVFTIQPLDTPTATTTLLKYFDTKYDLVTNQNTKANYKTVRKHLSSYLIGLGVKDIELLDVNIDFLVGLKNYLRSNGREGSSVLRYFTILIAVLSSAFEDGLHTTNLYKVKKKLKISKIKYTKSLLTIPDIKKLLDCDNTYINYKYVNIALLQLFGNGMRQSDVFLLRFSSFHENSLVYISQKTKKILEVPYSDEVVDILFNLFSLIIPSYTPVPSISNFQERQKKDLKLQTLKHHIGLQEKNDLIFQELFKNNSLYDYDVRRDMTEKQFRTINYLTQQYNKKLKEIKTNLTLEISNITSHTFRHSYTNLMLDSGMDVYDISNSLGHSNVSVTQSYIKSDFPLKRQYDNATRITKLLNKK